MTTDPGIPLPGTDDPAAKAPTLAAELRAVRVELQHALQLRDEFMAMVVHELRTPLSVLAMDLRVRQRRLEIDDAAFFASDNLARMFQRDQRQLRSLTRLVDDMLDVSLMRDGRLSIRRARCDLVALLRRVVAEMEDRHGDADLTLETDCTELHGEWDEFRLEQAIVNLLTNALQYGEGKPDRVELSQLPGAAAIRVRDQGVGIAPADRARVFEQSVQAGDRLRTPGLGLGLFITKQLVEAHGGTIDVESAPGEGATFTVTLPTVATEALAASAS